MHNDVCTVHTKLRYSCTKMINVTTQVMIVLLSYCLQHNTTVLIIIDLYSIHTFADTTQSNATITSPDDDGDRTVTDTLSGETMADENATKILSLDGGIIHNVCPCQNHYYV